MNVTFNLKQRRKAKKLTQEEVSKIIGVSRRKYISLESDESNLTFDQIKCICKLFALTLLIIPNEYLGIGESDNRPVIDKPENPKPSKADWRSRINSARRDA